jgi:hypothetical protein
MGSVSSCKPRKPVETGSAETRGERDTDSEKAPSVACAHQEYRYFVLKISIAVQYERLFVKLSSCLEIMDQLGKTPI